MARTLALDIGTKRTGVAFLDEVTGIPLPLDTIAHTSVEELVAAVHRILGERKIDRLIVGLPLLPSGAEGSQARFVRSVASKLSSLSLPVEFKDERYTTPRSKASDPDAAAACNLL